MSQEFNICTEKQIQNNKTCEWLIRTLKTQKVKKNKIKKKIKTQKSHLKIIAQAVKMASEWFLYLVPLLKSFRRT